MLGALAEQAAKQKLDVLLVTNDKDMMQLVGDGVRVLRPGTGGMKNDVIVDAAKVKEILGVTPEQVVDYMALFGDSIDNIPGAKGIGEKGAAELIQKYGTVENALDHADEVPNKRYREALQQQREQVLMSKQLARIATDVPVTLDLEKMKRREPDVAMLTTLYRELGFNSLLKELGAEAVAAAAASEQAAVKTDYAQLATVGGVSRRIWRRLPAKAPMAVWFNLETGEREAEGFGTRVASIEVSSKAGEGRSVWMDEKGEALKALAPLLGGSEAAEDRARSEAVSDFGRAGGEYSARDADLFVFAAADDRESQFRGCGDAAVQRDAGRRSGRARGLSAAAGAGVASGGGRAAS